MHTQEKTFFSIEHSNIGSTKEIILKNPRTGEMVSILPELGACLNRLVLQKNQDLIEVTDCAHTEAELADTQKAFKGSFLYPFPNRVRDGKYHFDGFNHQFPINFPHENNAIHGLVLNKTFKVVQELCTEQEALLGLEFTSLEEPGYPFPFKISIELVLSAKKGFGCKTIVHNQSMFQVPAAIGWHPYFRLGETIDACQISFPARSELLVDQQMIPTGAKTPELQFQNFQALKGMKLDTCFGLESENMHLTRLFNPSLSATLTVWQGGGTHGYNYLQLYIPEHRRCIAIEPMTSAPDAFNNSLGLLILEPCDTFECSFGVYLE